jgi:urocanate hydratase
MATLTATVLSRAGVADLVAAAVAADAALSDKWANTGKEFVFLNNGGGVTCTVTLTGGLGLAVDGQTPAAKTVVVLAGKAAIFGPFPKKYYDDALAFANIGYSQVASVKVLVFQFPGTPDVN